MIDKFFHTLEQILIEKQEQKDLMIKEIEKLQQNLSQLNNDHYELYGEIESLEHVIEIYKRNNI